MENNKNVDSNEDIKVEELTVYQKYGKLKQLVRASGVEKDGRGKVGKGGSVTTKHFRLDDIIPVVEKWCEKLHLTTIMNINRDLATLTLYDLDNDTSIDFIVPYEMSSGINDKAQANGAGITYTRRYAYVSMLDIIEEDKLESGGYTNTKPVQTPSPSARNSTPDYENRDDNTQVVYDDQSGTESQNDVFCRCCNEKLNVRVSNYNANEMWSKCLEGSTTKTDLNYNVTSCKNPNGKYINKDGNLA